MNGDFKSLFPKGKNTVLTSNKNYTRKHILLQRMYIGLIFLELKLKSVKPYVLKQKADFLYYSRLSDQADFLEVSSIKKLKKYTDSEIIDMIIEKVGGRILLDTDELLKELGFDVNIK